MEFDELGVGRNGGVSLDRGALFRFHRCGRRKGRHVFFGSPL
jgi:hypothetical protein